MKYYSSTLNVVAVLLCMLFTSNPLYATDYYVDNAVSGSNNSGTSWENAWTSFDAIGWNLIQPGDTVYISGGSTSKTYTETLTPTASGSSGNLVTVKKGIDANHNGEVIIDGEGSRSYCIDLDPGPDYLTVSYITLTDPTDKGIRCEDTEYVTLDHITYHNASTSGMRIVSNDNVTISYFDYSTVTNTGSQTDGMQTNYNNDFLLEHSTIRILNSGSGHNDGFQKNQGTGYSNGTIRYNTFDLDNTDTEDSQGIFLEDAEGTWNVYNNVIDGHDYVKALVKFKTLQSGSVLSLYNNTIISGDEVDGNVLNFTGTGTFNMKNNIVVVTSDNAVPIAFNLTGTKNIDYNIWFGMGSRWFSSWQGNGHDANGQYIDPDLNASHQPSDIEGPSVDNGVILGSFTDDIDRVSRPQGSAWDIGAFEYIDDNSITTIQSDFKQKNFTLNQNYPNPFNPSTTIDFNLSAVTNVKLEVYNSIGKKVATIVSERLNPGMHYYRFDGKNLASGIYYYQLTAGRNSEIKKMLLIR